MSESQTQAVKRLLLDYEVRGAWWPHFISHPTFQRWAASYFVRKVNRKLARMAESHAMKARVAAAAERDIVPPQPHELLNR